MKTINNFLYLPVPIGVHAVSILAYPKQHELWYLIGEESEGIGLPSKDLEVVCLASEMTEEVAKGLVEKNKYGHDGWKTYTEKSGLMYWESSALESFHSLMEANEMYLVNPMGKEPKKSVFMATKWVTSLEWDKWQSYQNKLSDYVILKRK